MRSEKEIRKALKEGEKICRIEHHDGWMDALEWVLSDDKEAVVCPLLGEEAE